jgi:Zn-finger nucleic acid-binding protein
MAPLSVERSLTVKFCDECGTVWCDANDVASLIGRAVHVEPDRAPEVGARVPQCPLCPSAPLVPAHVGGASRLLLTCVACGGVLLDRGALAAMRNELDAHAHPPAHEVSAPAPAGDPPDRSQTVAPKGLASERFAFDDPDVQLYALPAAFLMALLATLATGPGLGWILAGLPSMVLHELGHAATAWMAGRLAFPVPFLTVIRDGRSPITSVVVLGVAAGSAFIGYRSRCTALVVFGAAALVLHIAAFALSDAQTREWFIFGGCAGHIVFSTVLVLAFYVPLPDFVRWDFWRFGALLFGATTLVSAATTWIPAARDATLVPMGSAVGEKKDGDMSVLVARFGWTVEGLASVYAKLTLGALLLVTLVYAGVVLRVRLARTRTKAAL